MAAASLDVNFKEELSAIEQCLLIPSLVLPNHPLTTSSTGFKVLSEAERTAALYSLLQHSTQVQIRFFITVLQQMARSDPMTALLSPAVGGSMQAQMEAKLASMALKSPGLKSNMPSSPSARSFPTGAAPPTPGGRQSLAFDSSSSFLSPDSAAVAGGDAAATLAQQRAKLNANHAARRISAPALASAADGRNNVWSNGTTLSQVTERANSPSQELTVSEGTTANRSRPQSTDFSGMAAGAALRSPRPDVEASFSPMAGDSWASMVNTPLIPMFSNKSAQSQGLDAAAQKLNEWTGAAAGRGGVPLMDDAKKYRRASKSNAQGDGGNTVAQNGAVYDDAGNLISQGGGGGQGSGHQQQQQQQQQQRNASGGLRNVSGNGGANGHGHGQQGQGNLGPGGWNGNNGARSPALSNVSSGRFGSDSDSMGMGGGMGGMPGFGGMGGLASPALAGMNGMNGMNPNQLLAAAGMFGMNGMNGMNMNMLNMANLSAMGISPEAQILAAQMAAANGGLGMNGFGGMGQPGLGAFVGMGQAGMGGGAGMRGMGGMGGGGGSGRSGGRSPGLKSNGGGSNSGKKGDEEDVDPALLNDIPAWLRSLRLHKYTPNFEGVQWRDMVVMDEAALEAKGVAALGARRKMLKTFEVVRKKMGIEGPAGSGEASS